MDDGADAAEYVAPQTLANQAVVVVVYAARQLRVRNMEEGGRSQVRGSVRGIAHKAGGNEHHLVGLAVAVPVVNGKVGIGSFRQQAEGLSHVLTTIAMIGVVTRSLVNLHGAVDVELQVQAACRLVAEVVGHTALSHALVEPRLIKEAVVVRHRMVHREIQIAEREEHYGHSVGLLRIKLVWFRQHV